MTIYIASDHAGFELKNSLIAFLKGKGIEVEDGGPYEFDATDDYPDYILPLAKMVAQNKGSFGIAIGGSGQGEGMAANRVKGARATVYYGGTTDIVRVSREHNDANILALGARFISPEEAQQAVELWLNTPYVGNGRHVRRIEKLDHD